MWEAHSKTKAENTPFDVSEQAVRAVVVKKERLREPHAGDAKGAGARQAFGGAGFEVTGLNDALEEQLKSLAKIGIQVSFPRLRVRGELLGGEQPTLVLSTGSHEVPPSKAVSPSNRSVMGELLARQGVHQDGACPHGVRAPARKERNGGGKDEVAHVPAGFWGEVFRITAILLALFEVLSSILGVVWLRTQPKSFNMANAYRMA